MARRHEEREVGRGPALVPQSVEELCGRLRLAGEQRLRLLVRGAATRRIVAPTSARLLSCAELSGIEELEEDELILVARAGTPLRTVAAACRARGLVAPPLFDGAPEGTIGGLYSDPRECAFAPRWGHVRDQVLGVEAVRGDGVPFHAGGRVVKNVTGYDLCRFLCGARGRYAVVTAVVWRLAVRPAERWRACVTMPSADAVRDALARMRALPTEPHLLEWRPGETHCVAVEECGAEGIARRRLERHLAALDAPPQDTPRLLGGDAEGDTAPARHAGRTAEEDPGGSALRIRVRAPCSAWPRIVAQPLPPGVRLRWRAVYPLAHFALATLAGDGAPLRPLALLRSHLAGAGGSVAVEEIPASWPRGGDPWGRTDDRGRVIAARLRREWDPGGVLAYDEGAP